MIMVRGWVNVLLTDIVEMNGDKLEGMGMEGGDDVNQICEDRLK